MSASPVESYDPEGIPIQDKTIIIISRQFGSGGREIGVDLIFDYIV
ncbi:hypothetical protein [Blautia sp.]|nr:hypothetical protein [Blautia sp.]